MTDNRKKSVVMVEDSNLNIIDLLKKYGIEYSKGGYLWKGETYGSYKEPLAKAQGGIVASAKKKSMDDTMDTVAKSSTISDLTDKTKLAWAHVARSGIDSFVKVMVGPNALPIFCVYLEGEHLFMQKINTTQLGKITGFGEVFFEINLTSSRIRKKMYVMGALLNFLYNRYILTDLDGDSFELHVPKRGKRMLKSFVKGRIAVTPEAVDKLNKKLMEVC